MLEAFIQLGLFTAKSLIIVLMIIIVLVTFFMLLAKGKQKTKGKLSIKNLNQKYDENKELILAETLNKKQFKQFLKEQKSAQKNDAEKTKNIYIINFQGDMQASAVSGLRQEVTAILNIVKPSDEVVVNIESAGGVVHGYGLAAAQLMRFRSRDIPLTVTIDKIAASGGYLMACVANKILSAPFAIIGSIGVVVQLPNFHRLLKDKHIDFELHTAGEFKRTITLFGENTTEGKEKLQHEIEDIHQLFKHLITAHRPQINIENVATGEHWLGQQALLLKLVDEIKTSDEYLLEQTKQAKLFEVSYEIKKPFLARLTSSVSMFLGKLKFIC